MDDFCYLPTEGQKWYAEHLGREYGRSTKYRYLAVVTKQNLPNYGWFKGSARSDRALPQIEVRKLARRVELCHEIY